MVASNESEASTEEDLVQICLSLRYAGVVLGEEILNVLRAAKLEDALRVLKDLRLRMSEHKDIKLDAADFITRSLAGEAVETVADLEDNDFPEDWDAEVGSDGGVAAEVDVEYEVELEHGEVGVEVESDIEPGDVAVDSEHEVGVKGGEASDVEVEVDVEAGEQSDVEVEVEDPAVIQDAEDEVQERQEQEEEEPAQRIVISGKGGTKGVTVQFRKTGATGPGSGGKGRGAEVPSQDASKMVKVRPVKRDAGPQAPRGVIIRTSVDAGLDIDRGEPAAKARKYDKMVDQTADDLEDMVQNLSDRGIVLSPKALASMRQISKESAVGILVELSDRADLIPEHSEWVISAAARSHRVEDNAGYTEDTPVGALINPAVFKLRLGAAFKAESEKMEAKGKGKKGPGLKPEGCTTIVAKGLPPDVEEEELISIFQKVAPVKGCRLLRDDDTGESRGVAFIDFEAERLVDEAIKLHGIQLRGDRKLSLDYAKGKGKGKKGKGKAREPKPKPPGCTKVVVLGLAPDCTEEHLLELFEQIGPVKECTVLRDRETGDSRCLAFVDYDDTDLVDEAVKLSGIELRGKQFFVDYAESRDKGKAKGKAKGNAKGNTKDNANGKRA